MFLFEASAAIKAALVLRGGVGCLLGKKRATCQQGCVSALSTQPPWPAFQGQNQGKQNNGGIRWIMQRYNFFTCLFGFTV